MQAAVGLARKALRPILDFALPPRCPGCGAVIEEPHRFCLDCWSALDLPRRALLRPLRLALRL